MATVSLYTDGGARGNPGPSAAGCVIIAEDGTETTIGQYLGEITNNQAENQALLLGIDRVMADFDAPNTELTVYMDSELIVKQIKGDYRVKHPELKPLYDSVIDRIKNFAMVQFVHIPREKNKKADALVNLTLDNHDTRSDSTNT